MKDLDEICAWKVSINKIEDPENVGAPCVKCSGYQKTCDYYLKVKDINEELRKQYGNWGK